MLLIGPTGAPTAPLGWQEKGLVQAPLRTAGGLRRDLSAFHMPPPPAQSSAQHSRGHSLAPVVTANKSPLYSMAAHF